MTALATTVTVGSVVYAAGTDHTAMPSEVVDVVRNPSAWVGGVVPALSADNPQHVTLTASTVATVTFADDYPEVEVVNVDGAAAVYFTVGATGVPTVGGNGCNVLPAAIGYLSIPARSSGDTIVKLISSGTPKVSVRGVRH